MNNGGSETTAPTRAGPDAPPSLIALGLGSVGVVYGDIGTSPLYAFREAAMAASNDAIVTREILLRADNNGEGGTLSLTALATRALGRRTAFVFVVGVIGASMFLGDSVITPAISVLSAVEGLRLASPAFGDFVVPLTVIILIALFAVQLHYVVDRLAGGSVWDVLDTGWYVAGIAGLVAFVSGFMPSGWVRRRWSESENAFDDQRVIDQDRRTP